MKSIYCTLLFMASSLLVTSQNVGVGTSNPLARLHVVDSSVLFTGSVNAPTFNNINPPIQGAGTRMMWFPSQAALRAGFVDGTQWNKDSIGKFSIAMGYNSKAKGEYSLAMGGQTTASGDASTSLGFGTTASGTLAFSIGFETIASGSSATSMGFETIASGSRSTSMGVRTVASGNTSTSLGFQTTATSFAATSLGNLTTASGYSSTSMGEGTIAKSFAGLAIGRYNDISDNPNSDVASNIDRIFQIGNGNSSLRQNAITVLRNGNIGIGTLNPAAKLHVIDSGVLFTGPSIAPVNATTINTPAQGAGTRMMWFPARGAFRMGFVAGSKWDRPNIGAMSTAIGYDTEATEQATFASGYETRANGFASSSFGLFTTASGLGATSFGTTTFATLDNAVSMGTNTIASGLASTSMGSGTTASGYMSTSMGQGTTAKSFASVSIGTYNDNTDNPLQSSEAPTDRLFQVGNGVSNLRQNAITVLRNGKMGIGVTNPQQILEVVAPASVTPATLVIGNKGGFGPSAVEFVSDYGLIGQWRPGYIRSNDLGNYTGRLEFYTNGIGNANLYGNVKGLEVRNGVTLTATGTVGSYSDARLKHSITSFTDGLNIINKINPVQFYYNADAPFASDKQQIGIIAQELELLAPYMVEQNKEGKVEDMRTVNNQAYTFLLINAVKEQQMQLEKQAAEIKQQKNELEALKLLVKDLLKK